MLRDVEDAGGNFLDSINDSWPYKRVEEPDAEVRELLRTREGDGKRTISSELLPGSQTLKRQHHILEKVSCLHTSRLFLSMT